MVMNISKHRCIEYFSGNDSQSNYNMLLGTLFMKGLTNVIKFLLRFSKIVSAHMNANLVSSRLFRELLAVSIACFTMH